MCNQLLRKLRQEIESLGNIMRPIASVLRAEEPLVWSVSFAAFFSSFLPVRKLSEPRHVCWAFMETSLHRHDGWWRGGKSQGLLSIPSSWTGDWTPLKELLWLAKFLCSAQGKGKDSNPNAIITVSRYAVSFCSSPLVRVLPRWSESGLEICITILW